MEGLNFVVEELRMGGVGRVVHAGSDEWAEITVMSGSTARKMGRQSI